MIEIVTIITALISAGLYHCIKYHYDTKALLREKLEILLDLIAEYEKKHAYSFIKVDDNKVENIVMSHAEDLLPLKKIRVIITLYFPTIQPMIPTLISLHKKYVNFLYSTQRNNSLLHKYVEEIIEHHDKIREEAQRLASELRPKTISELLTRD